MSKYQFTPQAVADLFDIWSFIADDNPARQRIGLRKQSSAPLTSWRIHLLPGRVRSDLTSLPLRFWVVQPYSHYLIVYDPEKKPLQKSSESFTVHEIFLPSSVGHRAGNGIGSPIFL
ncbi:MAG TPA: type II toxin-antitoxin system RelE/ParE family toxin [Terriglobales bacterium]|jgi:hypothetical protein|nr:type II toxin-antitoxin system RelE/ParE family toxin [Terriglobales bacterium]